MKVRFFYFIFLMLLLSSISYAVNQTQSISKFDIPAPKVARANVGGAAKFPGQANMPFPQPKTSNVSSKAQSKSIKNRINTVDNKIKYDQGILDRFNNQTWLDISVEIKDNSGLVIAGTKKERKDISRQRDEWFQPVIGEILSNLRQDEFRYTRNSSTRFRGHISKKGFNKLIDDRRVAAIYTGFPVSVALDDSVSLINVRPDVWNLGYTGVGMSVCVIDTGVNANHPDLNGKVIDQKCYCRGNCCQGATESSDATDDNGHGTHVAGIIASQDSTYKGVAPDVDIYAVKVLDSNGNGNILDVGDAIDWCKTKGVNVISISIGDKQNHPGVSACPSDIDTSINNAYNANIPVIVASGNNGYTNGISYPACSTNVISVGATVGTPDFDDIWYLTNEYTTLDLLAPGVSIRSLRWDPNGDHPICYAESGNYMTCDGTSQATPHVAGAAALLLDKDSTLTPNQIKETLQDTGTMVDGYPRINVLAAIESINPVEEPPGDIENCVEPGYENCIRFTFQDCDVSMATNYYSNVNDIRWGDVNDGSDPYVIGEYKIGWKGVDTEKEYYDIDDPNGGDCHWGGCDGGERLADTGTKVTVTAPGTATTKSVVGYDDTSKWACWVWFNGFNPSLGSNNPIYVLNCFEDSDCASGNYCDKTGSWNQWSCVPTLADGQSCTSDSQCQSNYCDDDGAGLADDGWCFTPYTTYFDGQETSYCEVSTGNGTTDCDERQVGDDLNKCVGISYYEDECSSICAYQDITSVFECTESSCSCTEPLCDGLTTGDNITTCASNQTYFADKCTSTAGGEERDNICRSSGFAGDCTADPECDGIQAGTGSCTATCTYVPPVRNITITSLTEIYENNTIAIFEFVINNTGDTTLNNTAWQFDTDDNKLINNTQNFTLISGKNILVSVEHNFSATGVYNAIATATAGNISDLRTITVYIGDLIITSLDDIYTVETNVTFEAIIQNYREEAINNINWTMTFGDGNTSVATNLFNLNANETILLFIAQSYNSAGVYNTTLTAENQLYSDSELLSIATLTAPTISPSLPNITFNEDEYNDTIDLDDYVSDAEDDDANLTWTYSGNTNITVNIASSTHIVNFTATANWYGEENITFIVNDTSGLTTNDTITVVVVAQNDPPTFNGIIPNMTWPEDTVNTSLNLTTYFSDIDGDNLTYTSITPTNISVSVSNETGIVTLTPDTNWNGIDYIVFIARDTSNTNASSNNVTLNVTPVNDAPFFSGPIPTIKWLEDIINNSLNLSNYFSDVDGDDLNYTFTEAENITITIDDNTSMVTMTPDGNFTGINHITFYALDPSGVNASSNNVTLNVTPVNDPPTITSYVPSDVTPRVRENNSLLFSHTSFDVDGDSLYHNWTLDSVQQSTNQSWLYLPQTGDTGIHSVTLFVSDGSLKAMQNWTVNVTNTTDIDVINLSVLHASSGLRIFEFEIKNIGPVNLTGINWSLNTMDSFIYSNQLTDLESDESALVIVAHEFDSSGTYLVTATASDGVSTDAENISVNISHIDVSNLATVYSSNTSRMFEFEITNIGIKNLTDINWSLDTGESIIYATQPINLTIDESLLVYVGYNYTQDANYVITATAFDANSQDSESIDVDILEINSFDHTNISVANVFFAATIKNNKVSGIGGINWTIDFDDGNLFNSTALFNLTTNETIFIYIEHQYLLDGNYTVNLTIDNSKYLDVESEPVTREGITTGTASST